MRQMRVLTFVMTWRVVTTVAVTTDMFSMLMTGHVNVSRNSLVYQPMLVLINDIIQMVQYTCWSKTQ